MHQIAYYGPDPEPSVARGSSQPTPQLEEKRQREAGAQSRDLNPGRVALELVLPPLSLTRSKAAGGRHTSVKDASSTDT